MAHHDQMGSHIIAPHSTSSLRSELRVEDMSSRLWQRGEKLTPPAYLYKRGDQLKVLTAYPHKEEGGFESSPRQTLLKGEHMKVPL